MDILNWLYLAKNKLVKTTVQDPTQDLVILGSNASFAKRGDKYQSYGMTVSDFTSQFGENSVVKININGTSGLSNTLNGVDFLAPFNNLAYNEGTGVYTPIGSKVRINVEGYYLVHGRYASYDMTGATDFMRLAVTTSALSNDLGTKLEYLDQGYIGTSGNGEATKQGSGIFKFNVGDYVGIVVLHAGAVPSGYPVFDNTFFNQPYLQITKLL
jgi:hypothetical protein